MFKKRISILLSFIFILTYLGIPTHISGQEGKPQDGQSDLTPEEILEKDFEILYKDLEGIPSESASHAGGISVIGENAFVVGVNPETSPLIAAARYGNGRVIVAGMSEYIDLAGESEIKTILTRNLLSWLTEEQSISYDGALDGEGEINLITNLNLNVNDDLPIHLTKVDNWLENDINSDVYNVAYVDNFNSSLDEEEIDILLDFIRDGGALLFAQKGWVMDGHPKDWIKQIYPNPRLYHYGIQNLLNEVGISLMTNNAASKNEVFPPLTYDRANDYHILQLIDQSKAVEEGMLSIDDIRIGGPDASAEHKRSIISTLISGTIGGLTASSPLLDQIREDARTLDVELPFDKKEYLYSNALFTYLVNQASLSPDQEKSQFADVFPGNVPSDTSVIQDKQIEIDFEYNDYSYIRMNIPPGNWLSTGLYAPAGETVTIEVPEGVENLDIQVGAHTDNLMGKDSWQRVPIVTYRQALEVGTNEIMSPYGGLVYFIPTESIADTKEIITISGVVNAPYFNINETTNEEWNETIKHYEAPWAELQGRQIILTLPTEVVKDVEDPEALMTKWDQMIDQYDELVGVGSDKDLPHRSIDRPHRFVFDIQVGAGLMHAGYPMVGPIQRFAQEAIDIESDQLGSWGFWHELGHQYQQTPWLWGDVGETTTNIHSVHIEEYFGKESNLLTKDDNGQDHYDKAFDFLNSDNPNKKYNDNDHFIRLVAFMQLQHAYGWEFYTELQTAYRELPANELPSNDQQKIDMLAYKASKISGENLVSFFEQWELSITNDGKERVESLNVPEPEVPVWTLRIYSASDMSTSLILDTLHLYKEYLNEDVYRLLNIHLTSVEHFENQGSAEKVIKHMKNLNQLLEHLYNDELISKSLYNLMNYHSNALINNVK